MSSTTWEILFISLNINFSSVKWGNYLLSNGVVRIYTTYGIFQLIGFSKSCFSSFSPFLFLLSIIFIFIFTFLCHRHHHHHYIHKSLTTGSGSWQISFRKRPFQKELSRDDLRLAHVTPGSQAPQKKDPGSQLNITSKYAYSCLNNTAHIITGLEIIQSSIKSRFWC